MLNKQDTKFIAAVKRAEKATESVSAYIIINPNHKNVQMVIPAGPNVGRVVISYGRTGMMVRAVAWLPGPVAQGESFRHHGTAGGGGYDRASAAMSGARFVSADGATMHVMPDDGMGWRWHLEQAGYIVAQAC
jgi:hypothetical protein